MPSNIVLADDSGLAAYCSGTRGALCEEESCIDRSVFPERAFQRRVVASYSSVRSIAREAETMKKNGTLCEIERSP